MVGGRRGAWSLAVSSAVACAGACSDYRTDGGACRPRTILATEQEPRFLATEPGQPFAKDPSCRVEQDGSLALTFNPPRCNPDVSWWAGCMFARHQDMQPFDRVGGGRGVLAARICVENMVRSTVNIRFGPPKAPSKFMRAVGGDEEGFTDGCRTIYLGPDDACYGEGCGRICQPAEGADGSIAPGSCTSFVDSELVLMNEWCVEKDATAPGLVTIRLASLTYYQAGCECRDDRDCIAPSACSHDGWREFSRCSAGRDGGGSCPGICSTSAL